MKTGQKIAFFREKRGLTQEELAKKLFVSRDLVSKWETGSRRPSNKMIAAISEIFGVEASEISDFDERIIAEISVCIPENMEISGTSFSALINKFLGTLSERERFIFIARYYHEKTSLETASCLGIKDGSVRKTLMIIRRKLTAFLEEENHHEES